ncbi:hypothetical protein C8255_07360 [filamentous cyanobacterium CCP3]|nr:hypothetical protein C8255_07360 [filamentous cyanobacterium CCP3]
MNSEGKNITNRGDVSQQNVYDISKSGAILKEVTVSLPFGIGSARWKPETEEKITLDSELIKLLEWLAQEQGTSVDIALKKAVATAAYIHDVTAIQGGKLLVKRKDNSLGEIVLR